MKVLEILKLILIIHEENTKEITAVSVVLYVIKVMFIYIDCSFDFLGLDSVHFKTISPMNSSDLMGRFKAI